MKYLLSLLLFIISSFNSYSQNNWLRSAGGENHDEALDMASTSDGHFVTVGYFSSGAHFGNVILNGSGFSDAFVHKIDANGNTVWAKKLGGIKPDRATSVACDNDGNIYVTGFFTDQAVFGNITLNEVSDSLEIFITKLNAEGIVQWAKVCGGVSDDYSFGIAVDDAANVIVTGQFREVGHFGNFTLTSDMYEDNSYWSYDVFVTKLDTNGNFIWAEKGSAADDDRGIAVCTDNFNNIYVTGQFSDTVTFDIVHLNDVANAGFLIKYSPDGEEQWFDKFAASQIVNYDIVSDNDHNILVTGEYIGQIAIFNDGIDFVPYNYAYNIFLAKFNQSGSLTWASHAGSDNFCSAKAISIGAENEAYIAGTFNCKMTEFSAAYGEGIFNSAGYRDVFVARFDTDGDRVWERQFASASDDFCAAIAYSEIADKPLIAGSYSGYFNVPANDDFIYDSQNYIDNWNFYLPNCNANSFCTDPFYSSFIQVLADGNKDIFFSSPVHLERQPYDFYNRNILVSPPCERPLVKPCISGMFNYECSGSNTCQDSILLCNPALIYLNTNTGSSGFVGPAYDYVWSIGGSLNQLLISVSDYYSIEIIREDGCWNFQDSVYVTVAPDLCPLLQDNWGFNSTPICTPQNVYVCSPDEVLLTASGFVSDNYGWGDLPTTDVTITSTGLYQFSFEDEYDCIRASEIYVEVFQVLDTIDPYLLVNFSPIDSSYYSLCIDSANVVFSVADFLQSPPQLFEENVLVDWYIYHNGTLIGQLPDNPYEISFPVLEEGWYQVIAVPKLVHPWPCESEEEYPPLEMWFHIDLIEDPIVNLSIVGDLFICPGDSTLITAIGADSFLWSGSFPFVTVSENSILIDEFGQYMLYGYSIFQGCFTQQWFEFDVESKPAPYVWMMPDDGVVCPGDSVQLWCETGLEYHWIGPLGNEIDNTQSIYVSTPGFYYCILTDSTDCILESNMVEVKEYSTPYLIAFPGADLCVNGAVLVQIATNNLESVWWDAPFFDDALEHWISVAGIYSVSVNSCGITTALDITITDSDTPASITPSSNIFCPSDTILLYANANMQSYTWQPGNIPFETLEITEPGTYYLTTTDQLGCYGFANYTVLEYPIEAPLSNDITICAGENALLNATSNNSIFWATDEEGNQIVGNSNSFLTPFLFEETSYYVFSQDEVCASDPTTVIVSIFPSSTPPPIGGDDAICLGANAILISPNLNGITYQWTLPDGSTSTLDSLFIFNASEEDEGWYYLTSSDENCSGMDSLYFEVVAQALLQLDDDNFIQQCEGSLVNFTSPVTAQTYFWETPNGSFIGPQTLTLNAVSQFNEGLYTLTVLGAVCEFQIVPATLDVNVYPDIILDPFTNYCEGGYMTLGFQNDYDNYLWNTGEISATINPLDSGIYFVAVGNNPNCISNTAIYIATIECIEGFVNVFSPNGDGKNDFVDFGILRGEIDAVRIYNRWGNVIKNLTPSQLTWNGTTDMGDVVSAGVYYYIIIYSKAQANDCNCLLPEEGYIQVFAE